MSDFEKGFKFAWGAIVALGMALFLGDVFTYIASKFYEPQQVEVRAIPELYLGKVLHKKEGCHA